jgi:sphinganine C4-monooxygenase
MVNISSNPTMANGTYLSDLPPLPSYKIESVPPLVPFIPDLYLSLILPIAAYWIVSLFFHYIDVHDIWPQYRLHTPAEILKRNHVSRYEVARDVIIQQIIQTIVGTIISITEPEELRGMEEYDIALWARRIRIAQMALPQLLGMLGLNAATISKNVAGSHPLLAGALAGGKYPFLTTGLDVVSGAPVPAFAAWEMLVAKTMYWYAVPAAQFMLAIFFVDTWQYFLHRAMHMNKWLYSKSSCQTNQFPGLTDLATFHSRHHRLYVPYAFGALYNHPFEGFLLDTLGAGIAYKLSFMTARQGMWFFTCSTIKTVDDHCGYALPWDPLQHITSNNAGYHDIHHQSWGIKTNFSQPFFTIWDRLLGTVWTGGNVKAKYERSAKAAQFQVDTDNMKVEKAQ